MNLKIIVLQSHDDHKSLAYTVIFDDLDCAAGGRPTMTTWLTDELKKIERAEELEIASLGRDGTMIKPVTIWVVCNGDDLYVRSVNGRTAHWFRGTQVRHKGCENVHIHNGEHIGKYRTRLGNGERRRSQIV